MKRELRADRDGDNAKESKKAKEEEPPLREEDEDNAILKEFHLQKQIYAEKKPIRLGKGGLLVQSM